MGKEALRTLTRTAAREWARHAIRANVICPGAATATYRAVEAAMAEMIAHVLEQVPMGYMGDPERDIGGVAAFLAGDDSRYVTGNLVCGRWRSHQRRAVGSRSAGLISRRRGRRRRADPGR